jgi:glycosyltransferase involved in cell wall biosynthesis
VNLLLIAPFYDSRTPGESWSTFKWIEGLSRHSNVTVLTVHNPGWSPSDAPTNASEVVNWTANPLPRKLARIGYELKPGYVPFYFQARKWIKERLRSGWDFDHVHQINPLALRYPSPAAGLGIPYSIGPLAGSLETPVGFASEGTDRQWFRKLRRLDQFRIRFDPLLRRTYFEAEVVFGVAPYVEKLLESLKVRRFEIMAETGVEWVSSQPKSAPPADSPLRLLFVGRVIRTKGVIDAIRAVAIAAKSQPLRFDIIGEGDQLEECKQEAARLGVAEIVHFHGRIPRESVNSWYQDCHVFLFPSFREPSGNVVFEAMSQGCPLIVSTNGGPGHVVNDLCGVRVEPRNPEQYSRDLADAILRFCATPALIETASQNALLRVAEIALWDRKIDRMLEIFRSLKPHSQPNPPVSHAAQSSR